MFHVVTCLSISLSDHISRMHAQEKSHKVYEDLLNYLYGRSQLLSDHILMKPLHLFRKNVNCSGTAVKIKESSDPLKVRRVWIFSQVQSLAIFPRERVWGGFLGR